MQAGLCAAHPGGRGGLRGGPRPPAPPPGAWTLSLMPLTLLGWTEGRHSESFSMFFHIHNGLNIVGGMGPAGAGPWMVMWMVPTTRLNASPASSFPEGQRDPRPHPATQRRSRDAAVGCSPLFPRRDSDAVSRGWALALTRGRLEGTAPARGRSANPPPLRRPVPLPLPEPPGQIFLK